MNTTTTPQALTMLLAYVAFHAPHGSECSSRIPYSPPRGFHRRDCDCPLRVAKENAAIVGNSHKALVDALDRACWAFRTNAAIDWDELETIANTAKGAA